MILLWELHGDGIDFIYVHTVRSISREGILLIGSHGAPLPNAPGLEEIQVLRDRVKRIVIHIRAGEREEHLMASRYRKLARRMGWRILLLVH